MGVNFIKDCIIGKTISVNSWKKKVSKVASGADCQTL